MKGREGKGTEKKERGQRSRAEDEEGGIRRRRRKRKEMEAKGRQ